MRRLVITLFFLGSLPVMASEPSSVLMAKGIQLLQENKKSEALKLLERAFQNSNDPNELRVIGGLILEAAPLDYPKRDAYLRYLVKFAADHGDYPRWMKELGDRSLNAGKLDEAEDWYLRALVFYKEEEKPQLQYQLAWVYWNKKQRERALFQFFEIYEKAPDFRENLRPDIARLWWELEQLPADSYEVLSKLSKADQQLIVMEWITQAQKQKEELKLKKSIQNVSQIPFLRPILLTQIQAGWSIEKNPCLFFENFLQPGDSYPSELLLNCMKTKTPPPPAQMLVFFQNWSGTRTEAFTWAQAETMLKANEQKNAGILMLEYLAQQNASSAYLEFTEKLLLSLSETEFRELAGSHQKALEIFIAQQPGSPVLGLLQSIDPKTWLMFQEQNLSASLDKKFWIKKALWQAAQTDIPVHDLRASMEMIWSFELNQNDKLVRDQLQALHVRSETLLPAEFGEEFKKNYDAWVSDIDRSIKSIQSTGAEWNRISLAFLQAELQKNIRAIESQIDKLELPPDLESLAPSFQQKKEELKRDLSIKYKAVLEAQR